MREITITSRDIISTTLHTILIAVCIGSVGTLFWSAYTDSPIATYIKPVISLGVIVSVISSLFLIGYFVQLIKGIWENNRSFTFGGKKNSIPKVKVNKL